MAFKTSTSMSDWRWIPRHRTRRVAPAERALAIALGLHCLGRRDTANIDHLVHALAARHLLWTETVLRHPAHRGPVSTPCCLTVYRTTGS